MEAKDIIELAEDVYVGEMTSPTHTLKSAYAHDARVVFKLPEDMPIVDKKKHIDRLNKELGSKLKVTVSKPRPKVTDTERILILACHAHMPVDLIAHTLGIRYEVVKQVKDLYGHYAIPQMPMVMVTDTSRFWDKNTVRDIDDLTDLNNPSNPLTHKELLRGSYPSQHQALQNAQYIPYNESGSTRGVSRSNSFSLCYNETESLKVHYKYTTDNSLIDPYTVVVSGKSVVVHSIPKPSTDLYYRLQSNYGTSQSTSEDYNTPQGNYTEFTSDMLLFTSSLPTALYRLYNLDGFKTYKTTDYSVITYNTELSGIYYTTQYHNKHRNILENVVKVFLPNQQLPEDLVTYTYVPYNYIRPHYLDRGYTNQPLTANGTIRYRSPNNTTLYFNALSFNNKRLPDLTLAVQCIVCDSKLHSVKPATKRCTCKYNPLIVVFKNINKRHTSLKPSTPYPQTLTDFYKYYTYTSKTIDNSKQVRYSNRVKQVVTIHTDIIAQLTVTPTFKLLIDDIDVTNLYTNFNVPMDSTITEPAIVPQYRLN